MCMACFAAISKALFSTSRAGGMHTLHMQQRVGAGKGDTFAWSGIKLPAWGNSYKARQIALSCTRTHLVFVDAGKKKEHAMLGVCCSAPECRVRANLVWSCQAASRLHVHNRTGQTMQKQSVMAAWPDRMARSYKQAAIEVENATNIKCLQCLHTLLLVTHGSSSSKQSCPLDSQNNAASRAYLPLLRRQ